MADYSRPYNFVTIKGLAQTQQKGAVGEIFNAEMMNGKFCYVRSTDALYQGQKISCCDLTEVFGSSAVQMYTTFEHKVGAKAAVWQSPLDLGREVVFNF